MRLETALSMALGVGLAAACGFRVFVPLFVAAIAARSGGSKAPLTHGLTKASVPEAGPIETTLPCGPGTTGVQTLMS